MTKFMALRFIAASSRRFALALLLVALVCSRADGDVGVVLAESLNSSAERDSPVHVAGWWSG